ncbi:MAG: peptidyl-prolyl cis-trans isomerase, partial [candidate division WOR-3 bacterium]
ETPEGKRRILDQLITEKLLLKVCEKEKLWLSNRVFEQLLTRRVTLLVDLYRRRQTTEKVKLDSATLYAEYKRTINDYKEPTRVRCRELIVKSKKRGEQIRNWAVSGKIPALVDGVVLFIPEQENVQEVANLFHQITNTDSFVALGCLAGYPARLPNVLVKNIGGKDVPDLSQAASLVGPFVQSRFYSFAFSDLSLEDLLYQPQPIAIQTWDDLTRLLPPDVKPDSSRLGTYCQLVKPLPLTFTKSLFQLNAGDVSAPYPIPGGHLVVKITRKDTTQKADFAELIRRFSAGGSKWAGGELSLTPDDKSRDPKIVRAAYSLSKGSISPVIKINDTTYTILKIEEKKPAYTRSFSEVRSKIETRLRREKEKQLYDELIKNLRAQAKIEILMKEEDFKTEESETGPEEK